MLRRTRLNPISKKRRERSEDIVYVFPKPKDQKRMDRGAFSVAPFGQEVCYTTGSSRSQKGCEEYRRRTLVMLDRQHGLCCLYGYAPNCPGRLNPEEATFEHENGRGGGKRDDRIEVDGRWINGAAHLLCNQWKGSRRIDYNSALQGRKPDAQGN